MEILRFILYFMLPSRWGSSSNKYRFPS